MSLCGRDFNWFDRMFLAILSSAFTEETLEMVVQGGIENMHH